MIRAASTPGFSFWSSGPMKRLYATTVMGPASLASPKLRMMVAMSFGEFGPRGRDVVAEVFRAADAPQGGCSLVGVRDDPAGSVGVGSPESVDDLLRREAIRRTRRRPHPRARRDDALPQSRSPAPIRPP